MILFCLAPDLHYLCTRKAASRHNMNVLCRQGRRPQRFIFENKQLYTVNMILFSELHHKALLLPKLTISSITRK